VTNSIRVLVIDPVDQVVAQYVSALLPANYLIDRARNLKEALSLAAKSSYDVAVVDMQLPDGTGSDAWHMLKSLYPDLVGIITTSSLVLYASVNPGDGEISAYLLKPFRMDVLRANIASALARAGGDAKRPPLGQRPLALPAWQWSPEAKPYSHHEPEGRKRRAVPIATTFVILLLVLILGGAGTAYAAQAALPGDGLYPVKTSIEGLEVALTPDGSGKLQLLLGFAQTRAHEVEALTAEGRLVEIQQTTTAYEAEVNSAAALLDVLDAKDRSAAGEAARKLDAALAHSTIVLDMVLAQVPDAAKPAIMHALAVSQAGKLHAEQHLENPGTDEKTAAPETPGPPGQGQVPPGQNLVPPGQNQTPPGQSQTAPGQNQVPPGQSQVPPGQNQVPPRQAKTPSGQDKTPGAKK
jgi:CheY-like chemotaxis protein